MSKKKKAAAPKKKKTASRPPAPKAKAAKKKAARPRKPAAPKLGRPTVSADEDLDLLFKEDFQARQVFKYLQARTVRELEQFSPEQIFKMLTKPMRDTVDGIRQRLAHHNRCLSGDEAFAASHAPPRS